MLFIMNSSNNSNNDGCNNVDSNNDNNNITKALRPPPRLAQPGDPRPQLRRPTAVSPGAGRAAVAGRAAGVCALLPLLRRARKVAVTSEGPEPRSSGAGQDPRARRLAELVRQSLGAVAPCGSNI